MTYTHAYLAALARRMVETDATAEEVADAVEKPWKHAHELPPPVHAAQLPATDRDALAVHVQLPLDAVLAGWASGDLTPWGDEFRHLDETHGDWLDVLASEVRRDGITTPVHLGDDGRVWDGHHRLRVASLFALKTVPVHFADASAALAARPAPAPTADLDALARLAAHLLDGNMHGRCAITAFPGEADDTEPPRTRGRCPGQTAAVRWEDGFADEVCKRHAEEAEGRGVLVVRPKRHDGTVGALS